MRGKKWYQHYGPLIQEFSQNWDPSRLRQEIESAIETGRRSFRDTEPFKLVLSETGRPGELKTRKVFDLKSGKLQTQKIPLKKSAVSCRSAISL